MPNHEVSDDLVSSVATAAATKALEVFREERRKEAQQRRKRCLKDTQYLLRNYRQIKTQAEEVLALLPETENEDFEFFENLMQRGDVPKEDRLGVIASIRANAKSTVILMKYVDRAIQAYQKISLSSKKPEDARRYRVLEAMCLIEEPLLVIDVADVENIDKGTVFRDFRTACENISEMLFGIRWTDRDKGRV